MGVPTPAILQQRSALYCIEAIGLSTMSPFLTPSSSFVSGSGTLNLFNVATSLPTRASQSLLLTTMPHAWVFLSRPLQLQGPQETWETVRPA